MSAAPQFQCRVEQSRITGKWKYWIPEAGQGSMPDYSSPEDARRAGHEEIEQLNRRSASIVRG